MRFAIPREYRTTEDVDAIYNFVSGFQIKFVHAPRPTQGQQNGRGRNGVKERKLSTVFNTLRVAEPSFRTRFGIQSQSGWQ